jgi:hypothetical protein
MTWRAPTIVVMYMTGMYFALPSLDKYHEKGVAAVGLLSLAVMFIAGRVDRKFRKFTASEYAEQMVERRMTERSRMHLPETHDEAMSAVLHDIAGRYYVLHPRPHFCTLADGGCESCLPAKGRHRT